MWLKPHEETHSTGTETIYLFGYGDDAAERFLELTAGDGGVPAEDLKSIY